MERLTCGVDEEGRPLGWADNGMDAVCMLEACGCRGKRVSAGGADGVAGVVVEVKKEEEEEEERGWRTGVISDRVAGRRLEVMRWRMGCDNGDRGIK